ncbi:Altronate dehydratase [bioreactor metagenome]|uniref:Altronate dehydratase n=1 Tax=bioreactor metagenome TaxID=1076179 RepID=A0A645IHB1_9ZZZZ
MLRILVINEKDNVGVLLEKGKSGEYFNYKSEDIKLLEDIEFGHKVALKDFAREDIVYKYGEEIGYALEDIAKGQWIHNHNMGCRRGK